MAGLSSFFLNPAGLIFLLFLIPLLLLYLIKPAPMRKTVPSLLFILSDTGRSKINRLFRNWFTDILLLFHILLFLFLTLSLAHPFVNVSQSLFVKDTIIIIDASASMQIGDRFEEAKEFALENLAEQNTIIAVQNSAKVLAENAPAGAAKRIIRNLDVTDSTTNLGDALSIASGLAGINTNVVIISDFLPSEGALDISSQIVALESKGAIITQKKIGEPIENVGIIDMLVRDDQSKIWVKNFAQRPKEVTVTIGDAKESFALAKQETKELSFATPQGVTEIELADDDAFMADNKVFLSTPVDNNIDILVFTNEKENFEQSNMHLAWTIINENFPVNLNIQYAEFPKVPELNHDVYVFYKANPSLIIPGYISDIKEKVHQGAALIVTNQNGLFGIDFQDLLPVTYVGEGKPSAITAERNLLTNEIIFGQVQTYTRVEAKDGVTIIAKADEDPILTLSKHGQGTIMYYGFTEGKETFSAENSYPVFWRRVIDLVTNRPTLRSLNMETGSLVSFAKEERLQTPMGRTTTQRIELEQRGLYILEDRTITANLLSDLESNSNRENTFTTQTQESEEEEKKLPKNLAEIFLQLGLLFVLLELLYIKFRGDI